MAATWKATTNVNRGATATPVLDKPASLADTNTLACIIQHDAVTTVSAVPSGWTHHLTQDGANGDSCLHLFSRYVASAAAEPASYTFTLALSRGGCTVSCIVAEGGDPTTVMDVAPVSAPRAATATPAAGPITPVNNGCLLIAANSTDPAAGTYTGTPTSGWTERLEFGVSATSNIYIETLEQATAASVTAAPTMSASDDYATVVMALRPAGVGVTYNDSPSGTALASGSMAEASEHASAPTGVVASSGSWAESHAHETAPVGAATLIGAILEGLEHAATPTGVLVASGWSVENYDSPVAPETDTGHVPVRMSLSRLRPTSHRPFAISRRP